jgi:hypothetical protein
MIRASQLDDAVLGVMVESATNETGFPESIPKNSTNLEIFAKISQEVAEMRKSGTAPQIPAEYTENLRLDRSFVI